MIYTYGVSLQGTYHIKNGIVCQDSHCIKKIANNIVAAAVADGLGSEIHSDIASSIAAQIATEYCADHITEDLTDTQILGILHSSFQIAQEQIEQEAKRNNDELDQYDTTLSLAVLINNSLFYGHSGDSGIVALTMDGTYERVTEQQRDQDGRVYPLYFGDDKWVFEKYPKEVCSVFLATDGIFETLFPIYLRDESVPIYVALAQYFMDIESLRIDEFGEETVQNNMRHFLSSIPDAQVSDDKTVVVLVNSSVPHQKQPDEYYEEPDWDTVIRNWNEKWRREAYPHLFSDDSSHSSRTGDE